ncbi:DNA cytosine methyltransferase [Ruegeria jejuensis]|uniref:DNA cytosine methyltransferase n=1 Tax=Ruegeria jejuensis TaxID=3233338 RepID=UPI00355AFE44
MPLRVIDLFCGPGGFSAGFEAAGFEVVAALDYDKDAVTTYSANHKVTARQQDLKEFNYNTLPDADIVIGGPPCTQFSTAKSNKTRNVLDGILLVQSFLRCVYAKKPKYWIMENVPAIQKYLPSQIPLRSIGIDEDGDFPIPTRTELIAADYGVPQKRRRYLIGNFPIPPATHYDPNDKSLFLPNDAMEWRTMGQVLEYLPDPLNKPKAGVVICIPESASECRANVRRRQACF